MRGRISVWFFTGLLLFIYGILITAAGLFGTGGRYTVLANLHAGIWWGAVILVLGIVYTWVFRPRS